MTRSRLEKNNLPQQGSALNSNIDYLVDLLNRRGGANQQGRASVSNCLAARIAGPGNRLLPNLQLVHVKLPEATTGYLGPELWRAS